MPLTTTWQRLEASILAPALLPIAQTPAPFAPNSTMKTVGKVPSLYNRKGEIVGMANWTAHVTTPAEIAKWSADSRLGIGIRARELRAFDVDVDDFETVKAFMNWLFYALGEKSFPYRWRENSPRVLVPFFYSGDCPKRRYEIAGKGVVELLGDGQQWVAFGRHPSGVDYRWKGDILEAPTFDDVMLGKISTTLQEIFGATESTEAVSARKKGETFDTPDPVADYLIANGWALQDTGDRLFIRCPNEAEHTTGEAGDGSTVWFKAGTNGYDLGHFYCSHAHCSGIDDTKFLKMIGNAHPGVSPEDFPIIEPETELVCPKLERRKNGVILNKRPNILAALSASEYFGFKLGYDEFLQQPTIAWASNPVWRTIQDTDITRVNLALQLKGFEDMDNSRINDVLNVVCEKNRYDSAQQWLDRLPKWDGVPRCEHFFTDFCGVENSASTRIASRYLWESLVGRILNPGVKADCMLVLYGEQGLGKSRMIAALSPTEECFTEISFSMDERDIYRITKGKVVVEVPELVGMGKKDLEWLKRLLSSQFDEYVEKHEKRARRFPRRYMMIGTTNEDQFLTDVNNRRIAVLHIPGKIDVDAVVRERDQLWAEAKLLYMMFGIEQEELEKRFEAINKNYRIEEPWKHDIQKFLESNLGDGAVAPDRVELSSMDILRFAVGVDSARATQRDLSRVGKSMKELGYERMTMRSKSTGKTFKGFVKRNSNS